MACATRSPHTAPSQQKGGRGCRVSACLNCTVGISLLQTSRCFHPHLCVLPPLGYSIPSCLSLLGLPGAKPKLVPFPSQRWWAPEPGVQVAWVLLGALFAHTHGHPSQGYRCLPCSSELYATAVAGGGQAHPEISHSPVSRSACRPNSSPFSCLHIIPLDPLGR